jgi:hypothetical protein
MTSGAVRRCVGHMCRHRSGRRPAAAVGASAPHPALAGRLMPGSTRTRRTLTVWSRSTDRTPARRHAAHLAHVGATHASPGATSRQRSPLTRRPARPTRSPTVPLHLLTPTNRAHQTTTPPDDASNRAHPAQPVQEAASSGKDARKSVPPHARRQEPPHDHQTRAMQLQT